MAVQALSVLWLHNMSCEACVCCALCQREDYRSLGKLQNGELVLSKRCELCKIMGYADGAKGASDPRPGSFIRRKASPISPEHDAGWTSGASLDASEKTRIY